VVNAALAADGASLFVGSYTDHVERVLIRRLEHGVWQTLLDTKKSGGVHQLWAADGALWVATLDNVHGLDLERNALTSLGVEGRLVWAEADRLLVFDARVVREKRGDSWANQPLPLDAPVAVSSNADGGPWLLGDDGAIARETDGTFTLLDEPAPHKPNDIWAEPDALLAVSGDDHGSGRTGPGAIMRWSADGWQVLKEAPHDALLGVTSAGPDRIFAVGGTGEDGPPRPVIWRFDGAHWTRRVLPGVDAFLWDVLCDASGACYASGTDNTFVDLDALP
jgi:hypothetical protein